MDRQKHRMLKKAPDLWLKLQMVILVLEKNRDYYDNGMEPKYPGKIDLGKNIQFWNNIEFDFPFAYIFGIGTRKKHYFSFH